MKYLTILILILASCTPTPNHPELVQRYKTDPKSYKETNPVIVIPGILGTRLTDSNSGKIVWGSYGLGSISQRTRSGMQALALPMQIGTPLHQLTDTTKPNETLDALTILPGLKVSAYAKLLQSLTIGGYNDQDHVTTGKEHINCFQFAYDWRRSNAENAKHLHRFIQDKRKFVETENFKRYGIKKRVKFDIVAHSMGGLLARYYLMHGPKSLDQLDLNSKPTWAGAKNIDSLIQVGSPNQGSAQSILQTKYGVNFSFILPKFQASIIGTYPSVYELLPHPNSNLTDSKNKKVDLYEIEQWKQNHWGLADPKSLKKINKLLPKNTSLQNTESIALNHLQKCLTNAKKFHQALDCTCTPPKGLTIHAFVAISTPTASAIQINADHEFQITKTQPGDGTVTQKSALSKMPNHPTKSYLPLTTIHNIESTHHNLTSNPIFIDQMLKILLTPIN